MAKCNHDYAAQMEAIDDGGCPLCLKDAAAALERRVEKLERQVVIERGQKTAMHDRAYKLEKALESLTKDTRDYKGREITVHGGWDHYTHDKPVCPICKLLPQSPVVKEEA